MSSYTSPKTWSDAVAPTAAELNEQIRDNLDYLKTELVTIEDFNGAKVYQNADQAITASSWQSIAFNSEIRDDAGMHDTVTNNSRLTVVTAGKYLICALIKFDPAPIDGKYASFGIFKNGIQYETVSRVYTSYTYSDSVSFMALHNLSAGDYLELKVYHNFAGNLTVKYAANQYPYFIAHRLGV